MFIRTSRLLLRPPWPEDAAAITAGISDWDVVRMLAHAPHPYTQADAMDFITRVSDGDPHPVFVILGREGDDAPLVGGIGLHRDEAAGAYELGYWLARSAWGRGYATEAARAVLELAFEGLRLPRVIAGHYLDNPASGRVLEKLGFTPVETVKRYCRARDSHVDCLNVALTRGAWLAHRSGQVEMHAA